MLMTDFSQTDSQSLADFLTIEEATEHSGYTGQYLRRMARKGRIRALKRGHFWLIELKSLQAYMQRAEKAQDGRFGPRELDE